MWYGKQNSPPTDNNTSDFDISFDTSILGTDQLIKLSHKDNKTSGSIPFQSVIYIIACVAVILNKVQYLYKNINWHQI